jgi:hypothetical protein
MSLGTIGVGMYVRVNIPCTPSNTFLLAHAFAYAFAFARRLHRR